MKFPVSDQAFNGAISIQASAPVIRDQYRYAGSGEADDLQSLFLSPVPGCMRNTSRNREDTRCP